MKKFNRLILLFSIFYYLFSICSSAQAPQSFNYQLIARDTAGLVLSNKTLGIQISILKDASNGIVVYSERHTATSNNYGLVSLAIGTGNVVVGSFQPIDWGTHLHFVKIEIDPAGGTNYFNMGTTQLVSVPYALYAEKAGNIVDTSNTNELQALSISNDTLYLTNGGFVKLPPSLWTQSGNNIYNNNSGNVGIGIKTPSGKLIVKGDSLAPPTEPLFEVKNKDGDPVFVVYPDSIHMYVNSGGGSKATAQGGFAVSGRSSSKGAVSDYFIITPDSARIYLDESPNKATAQGGFAVSGRSSSKGVTNDYLVVSPDSVRVYIETDNGTKATGSRGGFAVGGFSQSKGTTDSLYYFFAEQLGVQVAFLTKAQRDTISNPAKSSIIFNTTDSCLQIYLGYWENIWCTSLNCNYPTIVTHPAIQVIDPGQNAMFKVSSTGTKLNFQWHESTDGGTTWSVIIDGGSNPIYSGTRNDTLLLTNVPAGYSGYKYRCIVINGCGAEKTNPAALYAFSCGQMLYDTRDTKEYATVMINNQCWMAENLNIGTLMNVTEDQTNNSVIEKYCYSNTEPNCEVFGGLYQWAEIVQYINGATNDQSWTPAPSGNVQGICPAGWHLPANAEWASLFTYLGDISVAGGKMKETGTGNWLDPNVNATNESGFTGLPGGYSNGTLDNFNAKNTEGDFWSADPYNPANSYIKILTNNTPAVTEDYEKKIFGHSVRCIKN